MADQITAEVTFYREQRTVSPAALRDKLPRSPSPVTLPCLSAGTESRRSLLFLVFLAERQSGADHRRGGLRR